MAKLLMYGITSLGVGWMDENIGWLNASWILRAVARKLGLLNPLKDLSTNLLNMIYG